MKGAHIAIVPILLSFSSLIYSQPDVTPVAIEQVEGTQRVRIIYDLEHDLGEHSTVSVFAAQEANGVLMPLTEVSGSVGAGIMPGQNKEIIWDAGIEWAEDVYPDVVIHIAADDGQTAGLSLAGYFAIPAGEFQMGDHTYGEGEPNELPRHPVYLLNYYIQNTEVTNVQVVEVLNWAISQGLASADATTVSNIDGEQVELMNLDSMHCQVSWKEDHLVVDSGKEDYPCIEITWYGSMAYCNYLTRMAGGTGESVDLELWTIDINEPGFRLPTEAEWENAARGGSPDNRYPWGGTISHAMANYKSDPDYQYDINETPGWHPLWSDDGVPCTSPVGSFPHSGYGLYDMAGNVAEWCADAYHFEGPTGFYGISPYENPYNAGVPNSGRIYRGGSWSLDARHCRVANRDWNVPGFSSFALGFRTVSGSLSNFFPGADFQPFTLDLRDDVAEIWQDATVYENGWSELSWFGYFVQLENDWIYHLEHGYQYCLGADASSIYIYDLGLQSWIWTSDSLFPFLFKYGENSGWYWYFTGGQYGNRWFSRYKDFVYVSEADINVPVTTKPVPEGFALIPGGSFRMGDSFNEGYMWELPVHTVYLSDFLLQTTEVSNRQAVEVFNWAIEQGLASASRASVLNLEGEQHVLINLNTSRREIFWDDTQLVVNENKDQYPCFEITWYGAMAYCHYLTRMEGGLTQAVNLETWSFDINESGYRLPTEAEWEKAARGGRTGMRFPTGNLISQEWANYYSFPLNYYAHDISVTQGYHYEWDDGPKPYTSPVGSFPESGYGLLDMTGNVSEWCADAYDEDYYLSLPSDNPVGPVFSGERVWRGGNWDTTGPFCRNAARRGRNPGSSSDTLGFRVARSSIE